MRAIVTFTRPISFYEQILDNLSVKVQYVFSTPDVAVLEATESSFAQLLEFQDKHGHIVKQSELSKKIP